MPTKAQLEALLIRELGLEDMPRERQLEAIADLGGIVMQRVALVVLSALPKESHESFLALQESGDEATILEFLSKKVPDLSTKINQEIKITIAEYKKNSN